MTNLTSTNPGSPKYEPEIIVLNSTAFARYGNTGYGVSNPGIQTVVK